MVSNGFTLNTNLLCRHSRLRVKNSNQWKDVVDAQLNNVAISISCHFYLHIGVLSTRNVCVILVEIWWYQRWNDCATLRILSIHLSVASHHIPIEHDNSIIVYFGQSRPDIAWKTEGMCPTLGYLGLNFAMAKGGIGYDVMMRILMIHFETVRLKIVVNIVDISPWYSCECIVVGKFRILHNRRPIQQQRMLMCNVEDWINISSTYAQCHSQTFITLFCKEHMFSNVFMSPIIL